MRDLIAAMGAELHITSAFPDLSIEIGNLAATAAWPSLISRVQQVVSASIS